MGCIFCEISISHQDSLRLRDIYLFLPVRVWHIAKSGTFSLIWKNFIIILLGETFLVKMTGSRVINVS